MKGSNMMIHLYGQGQLCLSIHNRSLGFAAMQGSCPGCYARNTVKWPNSVTNLCREVTFAIRGDPAAAPECSHDESLPCQRGRSTLTGRSVCQRHGGRRTFIRA